MEMEQSVPKRRHIKFRRRWITRKKDYNLHNTASACNQEKLLEFLYVFYYSLYFIKLSFKYWLYINILENSVFICFTHVRLLLVQKAFKYHHIQGLRYNILFT